LVLAGLYYVLQPYFGGLDNLRGNLESYFEAVNLGLVFTGMAISFSSLQDPTKTQNKLSRKVWEHPLKGKIFIVFICLIMLSCVIMGLVGYLYTAEGVIRQVSVGLITMGLGMLGLLKTGLEMFEHHRLDKNPQPKEG